MNFPTFTRTVPALGLAILALLAGCARAPQAPAGLGAIEPLEFPADTASGEPWLAVSPEGDVYATWFQKAAGDGHELRLAKLDGDRWSAPVTVATGDSFFVNWADVPVLAALGRGRLAVSYPWKSGGDTYAYDVRIVQSADDGATWGAPVTPHRDGTQTEHGFVSLVAAGDRVRALWLDGRKAAALAAAPEGHGGGHSHGDEHGAEMTLRTAVLDSAGNLSSEAVLDERTCDCCPTAAIALGGDVLAVYRDRSIDEVRDFAVTRLAGGAWKPAGFVHADQWTMPACPVNGAALDAAGGHLAAAWFTESGRRPMVYVARSGDGGATFGEPVAVCDTTTLGRADLVLRDDGRALVSWIDQSADGGAVMVREQRADGSLGDPVRVAATSVMRRSGVPRMARTGDRVVFAWTEAGEGIPTRVRTAVADWR